MVYFFMVNSHVLYEPNETISLCKKVHDID